MKTVIATLTVWAVVAASGGTSAFAEAPDSRLREVQYDPRAVVTVPVKRGVVTHVLLDADEAITDVASGLGGDCAKPEAAWCIAAQAGGRSIFVKPKSTAGAANNLAVVTDRRTHAFRFVVLSDADAAAPVYRLVVQAPGARRFPARAPEQALSLPAISPLDIRPEGLVAGRLASAPEVANTRYSIAEGRTSEDIVPTLVFDDGRFTYFRFPGNREIPAVFHVLGDGTEALVNTRMEGDLLVVDRVSRRLVLRAGSAVVGVWNDAFDLQGVPPRSGTTVAGVERLVRSGAAVDGRPALGSGDAK
jgi:type IV secretion system protein VirB9